MSEKISSEKISPERVSVIAAAARVPLPEGAAERIARSVAPVAARMAGDDISVAFEIEPASYVAVARKGAKRD